MDGKTGKRWGAVLLLLGLAMDPMWVGLALQLGCSCGFLKALQMPHMLDAACHGAQQHFSGMHERPSLARRQ